MTKDEKLNIEKMEQLLMQHQQLFETLLDILEDAEIISREPSASEPQYVH
jgi:hypothetical protein